MTRIDTSFSTLSIPLLIQPVKYGGDFPRIRRPIDISYHRNLCWCMGFSSGLLYPRHGWVSNWRRGALYMCYSLHARTRLLRVLAMMRMTNKISMRGIWQLMFMSNCYSDYSRLSSSDAYLFPVLASAALLGMYLVFKYLGSVGHLSISTLNPS